MIILRKPRPDDINDIISAYERSKDLHEPWTYAPSDYTNYLSQEGRYFVCLQTTGEVLGTFHISGIVRGYFQSAYLGYEVFAPHQGKGYMSQGMKLLLELAFNSLRLHRLEANIQPGNLASLHLVAAHGFVKEGFSKHYLRVGGREWKDHERWAIINPHWIE